MSPGDADSLAGDVDSTFCIDLQSLNHLVMWTALMIESTADMDNDEQID